MKFSFARAFEVVPRKNQSSLAHQKTTAERDVQRSFLIFFNYTAITFWQLFSLNLFSSVQVEFPRKVFWELPVLFLRKEQEPNRKAWEHSRSVLVCSKPAWVHSIWVWAGNTRVLVCSMKVLVYNRIFWGHSKTSPCCRIICRASLPGP